MQPIQNLVSNALTEISAPPTKEKPICIETWERWFSVKTYGEPELQALVTAAARFKLAMRRNETPRWISILGGSGTGKTTVAARLWEHNQFMDWKQAHYIQQPFYWLEMVKRIRQPDAWEHAMILDSKRWPLLFLDDLGAERDHTGFACEQLNLILGMRTAKWTIVTSNLLLPQIAELDQRIASRLVRGPGNVVIQMENTIDYALRKNK